MKNVIAAAVTMIALLLSTTTQASTRQCLAKKRAAGFSGKEWFCNKTSTFRFVGRAARSGYEIYDYRYRFLPHNGGLVHGGQRIIIFRARKYVGQYPLATPPFTTMAVRGERLILATGGTARKVELDLSGVPPAKILVNGEEENLDR